ncbi:hypothetical protein M23134_01917 [Microscilla marina ATCC 23134]|uniref:Uncharacterized protein n=1 Tax=Microscilla marina ATCC 23134 TaxID=313606 RepID=A1ZC86_MICM2|nr:hypothetical protein M23134_01917 [Microscilla marina ATCC 23134]
MVTRYSEHIKKQQAINNIAGCLLLVLIGNTGWSSTMYDE